MALFEYRCPANHVTEELFRGKDVVAATVVCHCGAVATKALPRIARTPGRWGESGASWNHGLGCVVNGQKDIDRICNERGLVPLSDLPSDYLQTRMEHQRAVDAHSDRCAEALKTADLLDVNTLTALDEVAP